MRIQLVTPAPPRSRKGNRITALRWTRLLRELGHRVRIVEAYHGERCDLLIALHALRSYASIARFREGHPSLPLFVALTGTDLYRDILTSPEAQASLSMATRLILLQADGVSHLPAAVQPKARVIHQSVEPWHGLRARPQGWFQVCVLGHLRSVKDPFRTASAARLLPPDSRIRVVQAGAALDDEMAALAQSEAAANARYRYLGELPRWKARRLLANSHLLSLTSEMEGGANVISEALAAGVPIVSSRISGSLGLLGAEYPGYFPVGDTTALADLLHRAETDAAFSEQLVARCAQLAPLCEPERERDAWAALLDEIGRPSF